MAWLTMVNGNPWYDFPQQYTTNGGSARKVAFQSGFVLRPLGQTHFDWHADQQHLCGRHAELLLISSLNDHTFTLGVDTFTGDVVKAQVPRPETVR